MSILKNKKNSLDKNTKLPTNKNFGIVFSIVFLIIALFPLINDGNLRIWSLIVSIIFLTLGLINSKALTPLNKLWFKFGIFLGNIISPIVMGIIYFAVVTPIALFLKVINKDVLSLKKTKKVSYWKNKEKYNSSMRNQF